MSRTGIKAAEDHFVRLNVAIRRLAVGHDFDELHVDWSACLRHFKLSWSAIRKYGKEKSSAAKIVIYKAEHEIKRDAALSYMIAARNAEEHEDERRFEPTRSTEIGNLLIGSGAIALGPGCEGMFFDCVVNGVPFSGTLTHTNDGSIRGTASNLAMLSKERNRLLLNPVSDQQGKTVCPPMQTGAENNPLACAYCGAQFLRKLIEDVDCAS